MTAATAVGVVRNVDMKRPLLNDDFSRLSGTKFGAPLLSRSFQFSPNLKREPVEGRPGVFCEVPDGISVVKNLGTAAYDEDVLGGLLKPGLNGERDERRALC
jgi:hypothetical protein